MRFPTPGKETAVPYAAFKNAGFEVKFATELGQPPVCDKKMIEGLTGKLLVRSSLAGQSFPHSPGRNRIHSFDVADRILYHGPQGAKRSAVELYNEMVASEECQHPLSWSEPGFTFDSFNLVLFPGGHDKGVRQVIDSPIVHRLVLEYQPQTKKPSNKVIGAVCHGVMVLAAAKGPDGKSAIHDCVTTSLPGTFESGIFWGTRVFLGDYYKTYGAGSENVETYVSGSLRLTE